MRGTTPSQPGNAVTSTSEGGVVGVAAPREGRSTRTLRSRRSTAGAARCRGRCRRLRLAGRTRRPGARRAWPRRRRCARAPGSRRSPWSWAIDRRRRRSGPDGSPARSRRSARRVLAPAERAGAVAGRERRRLVEEEAASVKSARLPRSGARCHPPEPEPARDPPPTVVGAGGSGRARRAGIPTGSRTRVPVRARRPAPRAA